MRDGKDSWEVLYIWPYLEWGGAQIYFMGIMKHARERYRVRAIMPLGSSERLLSYMEQLNVSCEFFDGHIDASPAPTFVRKISRRWKKARTELVIVRHLSLRKNRRALLHVDFGPWSSFWLLLYLSLRSHVFVTLHTAPPELSLFRTAEWKLKFTLLTFVPGFHLLASNREMIESLEPFLPQRAKTKIRLAYSGIDRAEIESVLSENQSRAKICQRYQFPLESFLVFGMGQFIDRKGCWIFLEAAQELRRKDPGLYFVWIGTSPLDEATEMRIAEYKLEDAFRFITSSEIGEGRLGLLRLLNLADLFLLPSFTEGLPIALLEAMALGKACVASAINAIPEAIKDGESGVLVPAGNSGTLATAVERLRNNDALRERIARNARTEVLANFDEAFTALTTVEYYDSCTRDN